jgi:hypothetical protein
MITHVKKIATNRNKIEVPFYTVCHRPNARRAALDSRAPPTFCATHNTNEETTTARMFHTATPCYHGSYVNALIVQHQQENAKALHNPDLC